jgi:hypothetical protein
LLIRLGVNTPCCDCAPTEESAKSRARHKEKIVGL